MTTTRAEHLPRRLGDPPCVSPLDVRPVDATAAGNGMGDVVCTLSHVTTRDCIVRDESGAGPPSDMAPELTPIRHMIDVVSDPDNEGGLCLPGPEFLVTAEGGELDWRG